MSEFALHHLVIAARDPTRLAEFYESLLGLERIDDSRIMATSIWLRIGASSAADEESAPILMIEQADPGSPAAAREPFAAKSPGWHFIALRIAVDRRADWLERLSAADVRIESQSPYTIYFRDPEGNRVGLSHFPVIAPDRNDPDS